MWKCVSRSVKTFKKTVLKKSTVLSTKAGKNEELHCVLKFTPCILNRCNSFSNICRGRFEYFTNEKKAREGPKEKKIKFLNGLKDYFVDALKWSGLIAFVGYYEVYYKRRSIFRLSDPYEEKPFPRITGYYKALEYLIDNLEFPPYNCVFPEIHASKSNKGNEKFAKETEAGKSHEENFSSLEEAHQKVLGALSNWLGIQCMQSGQQKEALRYFLQSAEEEHAPGIFNLGLCHEKGYGTSQNFSKAAELYKKASDLGHATAMYNLGVFYAQGKGGIQIDVDHARELFKAAAHLGQRDAVRALNLEKQSTEELPHVLDSKDKEKQNNILSLGQIIFDKLIDQSPSQSERDFSVCDNNVKTNCENFRYTEQKEMNSSLGSDSGVLDMSSHNEPYVLLI